MAHPDDLVGSFTTYRMLSSSKFPGAERQLVKGVLPTQSAAATAILYDYQPVGITGLSGRGIVKSSSVIQAKRTIDTSNTGLNPDPGSGKKFVPNGKSWNFTFLKYVPGYTTVCPLTTNVLTGPMSGCFLFTYMMGGQMMVSHVGTTIDSEEDTDKVKAGWRVFAKRQDVSAVQGASPFHVFEMDEITKGTYKGVPPSFGGYFLPNGQAYAIMFAPVPVSWKPLTGWTARISKVKPMPLQPWSVLENHSKFKR
jgi:hypothetical protein